jgi:hypothetical protein
MKSIFIRAFFMSIDISTFKKSLRPKIGILQKHFFDPNDFFGQKVFFSPQKTQISAQSLSPVWTTKTNNDDGAETFVR